MGVLAICLIFMLSSSILLTGQEESDEEIDVTPFFSLNLISPDNNPNRVKWVNFTALQLPKIGIEVSHLDIVPWEPFDARSFKYETDPVTGIPIYDNGGYDLLAIGENDWNDFTFWGMDSFSDNLSPCIGNEACNFYWYQNPQIVDLYSEGYTTKDPNRLTEIIIDFQKILYEDVPTIILYENAITLFTKKSLGLSESEGQAIILGLLQDGWKSIGSQNNLTIAVPFGVTDNYFNPLRPLLFLPQQDNYHIGMVWQSLYEQNPNDITIWNPLLAKSLPTWNDDYTVATIDLRTDVVFADGHPLDSTDVVETYRMLLTPSFGSQSYSYLQDPELRGHVGGGKYKEWSFLNNNDSITAIDADTVQFKFNSSLIDFGMENQIFTFGILPTHIFGNHTNPTVHDYNFDSAIRSNTSIYGIGTGPYIFKEINATSDVIIMSENPNYWNGNVNAKEIYIVKEREAEIAFQKLVTGEYDILAQWYFISPLDFEESDEIKIFIKAWGYWGPINHEIAFNHKHPVFGTGMETPLGTQDPSKASEAAKYVRQAINHAIPRQKIIDEIMGGYGVPGTTKVLSHQAPAGLNIVPYEYNLTKSMELLKKAGYTNETYTSSSSSKKDDPNDSFLYYDNRMLIISIGLFTSTIVVSVVRRKIA
jgi:ABC-type transport system substrate-binding protein